MTLETRRLGGTSVEVTVLGLGGATLGGNMAQLTDADARTLVIDAFDSGIRYFDTAPFYGYGRSEHMVGDGLRRQDGWVLSTKVGRRLKPRRTAQSPNDPWTGPLPFEPWFDYSYDGAMRSYEDSLQRLGLDHIDILYIHDIDIFSHGAELQPKMHRAGDGRRLQGARRAAARPATSRRSASASTRRSRSPTRSSTASGTASCSPAATRSSSRTRSTRCSRRSTKHGASIVIGGPFNSGILVGRETWNYSKAPAGGAGPGQGDRAGLRRPQVPLAAAALQFPARPSRSSPASFPARARRKS